MNAVAHVRKSVLKASQMELATIASTTQATVSRWEKGELSPDLDQLAAIRAAVIERKLKWNDAWFFSVPERTA